MNIGLRMSDAYNKYPKNHHTIQTNLTGDVEFCGYSHCRGDCGYPGLFLRHYPDVSNGMWAEAVAAGNYPRDDQGRPYRDYKAHGSMVAHGPVWQAKRWEGERVYLPDTGRDVWDLIQNHYWR